MLTPAIEKIVFEEIQLKCVATDGVYFLGIGGTETHTHLIIGMEPLVVINTFIGKIKGASSYLVNKLISENTLEWQEGYGVVSFSKRDLPWVLEYVAKQKEHHAVGTLSEKLETDTTL